MADELTNIDTGIGAAIRAARFSRGLTQSDLAAHLGITRATLASYEIGRRKISAETLIQIAHLCGKPLLFFDPLASQVNANRPTADTSQDEQPALQALIQTLKLRPDALPLVIEFLEAWLNDQQISRA
jgi:transcriptional regulator with XRE-family HTH domain